MWSEGARLGLSQKRASWDSTRGTAQDALIFWDGPRMAPYHNKLNFDEVILNGKNHKVGGILAPCLLKDVGTMLVYRALRDK